ncbi:MAG: transporter [Deltaproteobacteria bacterium]|nr:transporter [Deltaproteobacteria bacterium]
MHRTPPVTFFVVIALIWFASALVLAQPLVQKSFSTQLFEPAIGEQTMLIAEPAWVLNHLRFDADLLVNYQYRPLAVSTSLLDSDPDEVVLVEHEMTADLVGALGLRFGWLKAQVGLALPINLFILGNDITAQGETGEALEETGLGDLRIQVKAVLFENIEGFSLAFSPLITVPTACVEAGGKPCDEKGKYGGDPNFGIRPRLVADFRHHDLVLIANLGWIFRQSSAVLGTPIDDRLSYALGAAYPIDERLRLGAELVGQIGFTRGGCRDVAGGLTLCDQDSGASVEKTPLEALISGRYGFGSGLSASAGVGVGLIQAYGAPVFRLVAGVEWAPDFSDSDKDSLSNEVDKCPTDREDLDGYQDEDGCPDPDNDQDMIPDIEDKCPLDLEDQDGFEDGDGCPEKDNDKDGIFDAYDECPLLAEDIDKFDDTDGCPDDDNDQDGIEDKADKCPNEQETINGNADDDGCPDEGESQVAIQDNRIVFTTDVRIGTGAEIPSRYHSVLQQLAQTLKTNKSIKAIKIEAFAPRSRNKQRDKEKALRVAEMVKAFLVRHGVTAERLSTRGSAIERKELKKRRNDIELWILDGGATTAKESTRER